MRFTHLVSIFETQSKVDEFEALVVSAPQYVAWLEVGMHVALAMQVGQRLQDVPGAVLHHPHGVALSGPNATGTLALFHYV